MTDFTATASNQGDSNVRARAKAPSRRTGPGATLCGLLAAKVSGAPSRRRALLVAAVVASLVVSASVGSASAQTRLYTGVSFGPEGPTGSATFADVQGVAVDQSTGDVFVYDIGGGGKIYKFDSTGEPVDFTATNTNVIESIGGPTEDGAEQIAIAPAGSPGSTAGDIYVANNGTVKVYSPTGDETPLGTLGEGETCGIAVDPQGHLFIGTYEPFGTPSLVREYLPTSDPPQEWTKTATSVADLNETCHVAADAAGSVYASNYGGRFTAKLEGIADPNPVSIEPGGAALATDSIGNRLYLDKGDHISAYDSVGVALYDFGTGELTSSAGIAVNSSADQVYAADGGSGTVKVFSSPVEVTTNEASEVGREAATLNGTVESGGLAVQECVFEYGPAMEVHFGSKVPCSGDAGTVTRVLGGLQPDTTYHFRLTVTLAGTKLRGEALEFSTVGPPRITEVSSSADRGSAMLGATVDPRGAETSYRIEWGQGGSYGNVAATGTIGAAAGPTRVSAHLAGLDLATAYHWRVVAAGAEGATASPDQVVETLNSCGLTDGRCYELVSRADKGPLAGPGKSFRAGEQIQFQAAAAGSAFAFTVYSGYPDATVGDAALYLARRGAVGWSSEQLTPSNVVEPPVAGNGSKFRVLSTDLACGIVATLAPLDPGAPTTVVEAGGYNLYLRDNITGAYRLISSLPPVGPIAEPGNPHEYDVIGMSPDCRRVVFRTTNRYPGIPAVNSRSQLYEWDDGTLRNVAVTPGPGGTAEPLPAESIPGAMGPNPQLGRPGDQAEPSDYWRAVSADGTRSVFTAISRFGADSGQHAIFLRDGDDPAVLAGTAPATDISQSETTVPNNGNSRYWIASADGSRIFFTARYGLAGNGSSTGATACANTPFGGANESGSGEGCDLYEYDAAAPAGERLADLSPDTTDPKGAGVVAVLDASKDGSYVYFAARGRLGTAGRNEAANLRAGTYNIYVAHGGEIRFVRSLGQAESRDGKNSNAIVATRIGAEWTSRATPDGASLVFESSLAIPGNVPMVYLYSATTGATTCISCRNDGRPAFSEDTLTPLIGSRRTNALDRIVQPTILTAGGRLYFYSFDPLAPGGVEGQRNLYQWEHGQVSLIATEPPGVERSNGKPEESFFAGASADGGDVYFASPQRLVGAAHEGWNVYDARVGGGFPEAAAPLPCDAGVEGACNPAAGAPSTTAAPPTSTFTGPGNPSAEHHKKRHHKRHRGHHRKRHGRKHHKTRHGKKHNGKTHHKKAGNVRRANSDRRAGK